MSDRDTGKGIGENAGLGTERQPLSPSDAFALLSNDTRVAAMEVLWEADDALRFTDIAERADITDTGNLNYHLGELDGRFIRREAGQYELTYSGRQAMKLVLTGDITDQPGLEPTGLDRHCPYCHDEIVLVHYGDRLRVLCTGCEGTYRTRRPNLTIEGLPDSGTITVLKFPAAGVQNREPLSMLEAGLTRTASRWRDFYHGLCPDCGGTIRRGLEVCADHEADGLCGECGSRFPGTALRTCRNCEQRNPAQLALTAVADPRTVAFFNDHGVDLLAPNWETARRLLQCEERVHSNDPAELEVIWTEASHEFRMRFDDQGQILDTTLTR